MQTNLIFQVLVDDGKLDKTKKAFYQKCIRTIQRYADRHDCEYVLSQDRHFPKFDPHFESFQILSRKDFNKYDKILFIDADVFALDTDTNIFSLYDGFTACDMAAKKESRRPEFQVWNRPFNSGIMLFDKETIAKMQNNFLSVMKYSRNKIPGRDQLAYNKLAKERLGHINFFNPEHCCFLRDRQSQQATLVHVAGRDRTLYAENSSFWDAHFEV